MATPIRIRVSRAHVGTLTQLVVLVVSQMPRCHPAATQHVMVVRRSILKSNQSINHRGPDVPQQLTEGKRDMSSQRCSILHVGQHLPLQLLRLGFRLAASTQLWEGGVWKLHPTVKLSVSHMAVGLDEMNNFMWWRWTDKQSNVSVHKKIYIYLLL